MFVQTWSQLWAAPIYTRPFPADPEWRDETRAIFGAEQCLACKRGSHGETCPTIRCDKKRTARQQFYRRGGTPVPAGSPTDTETYITGDTGPVTAPSGSTGLSRLTAILPAPSDSYPARGRLTRSRFTRTADRFQPADPPTEWRSHVTDSSLSQSVAAQSPGSPDRTASPRGETTGRRDNSPVRGQAKMLQLIPGARLRWPCPWN